VNLTQSFILIIVVVFMACMLVVVRGGELKEGYRVSKLISEYDELQFGLKREQSQIYRLKTPRLLEDRAIALGVKLVNPDDRKWNMELALAAGGGILTH